MKCLKDEVNLTGKFETITVSEFRARPGDVLVQVMFGKAFVIVKNGEPVAVISKPPGVTLGMKVNCKGELSYTL